MGEKTGIQWTDATWNPIRGCSRVSAGCMNCYAETQAARFAGTDSRSGLQMPYAGLIDRHGRWNGTVSFVKEHLLDPLKWTRPRRIFVNSMSDLFHGNVSIEWVDRIFAVMSLASHHTFQVLTKRPERMRDYMSEFCRAERNVFRAIEGEQWNGKEISRHDVARALGCRDISHYLNGISPPKNVWLGVSVEDQESADERISILLETSAALRFVSYEPALGGIDFARIGGDDELGTEYNSLTGEWDGNDEGGTKLDWVIVGGESGPGARRFDPAWARSVVDQCRAASVPVFVKQMGSNVLEADMYWPGAKDHWTNRLNGKGDDSSQWPEAFRVREFPR